ncbi:type III-B CRISPR-associated protein Cas10/Cmr2 [Hugenholtzia roseola]|uniref:type III-B CRISPR-associated protein Cas10/Cmr2 n=1 Tax=Hugenholtzia roseola TaxID=1002 RepID=UPI00040C7966|nr:type III-B CRISPR-associated protein Cas10/Cmr2 [Hugenholtzia roseola]
MKYLFLLTISPVQSFIEQARKTQDLRAGSQILSDLIDFAIKEVEGSTKKEGFELIFPDSSVQSKPNRFLAIIETEEKMQVFGDTLKEKIQSHFLEQAEQCLSKTGFYANCKAQLEDFFKIFWVAKEYKDNEPYEPQHERIEQLLGAVKANRPFKQLEEKGRKCSLNGELNVKFYRLTDKEKESEVKKEDKKLFTKEVCVVGYKDSKKINLEDLQAGEGLCAISFLKRVWKIKESSFPSVSEIALMNVINQLKETREADVLSSIKLIAAINEQFFYEDALTQKEFDRVMEISSQKGKANLESIKELQGNIARAAKKLNLQLSKYYAILVFDADSMGNKLKNKPKEYQKALSKCLGNFAAKATDYIDGKKGEVQKGKTVYAGGDDFLGFINLDYLFEAMKWLREGFDTTINKGMETEGHESPKLTFSAGVAIAHYKTPLSEVLSWARASEKLAKKKYNYAKPAKNAFCLSVLKGSGEIRQSTWKWSYEENNLTATLDIIGELVQKLVNEELSSTFIKSLNVEFRKLIGENGTIPTIHKPILEWELQRLMVRAKNSDKYKGSLSDLTSKTFELVSNENATRVSKDIDIRNFTQLLDVVDFLHRHINPISQLETTEA